MTATLVIDSDWPPGVWPGTALLGLPLVARQVLSAQRAGFEDVRVEPVAGVDLSPLLAGTRGSAGPGATAPGEPAHRMSARILPRVAWLRGLREEGPARISPADRFEIATADDLPGAERWLLSDLMKDSEGFMSRHFERKISLALSRRLACTAITPNAMTLISIAVGLVGAAFFLSPRAALETVGALLFLAHSILDGCDGELARLKFQESRWGGILDFWGDNVVHSAVFGAIAVGWWRVSGTATPLLFGASAIVGTLLSAAFVHFQTMRGVHDGPLFTSVTRSAQSRLSRLADMLARRDFIYLVILLSVFGRARWFLVLAALGAPAFFLVLVAIAVAGRPQSAKLEPADRSWT